MAPISPCSEEIIHDPNAVELSLSHRSTSACDQSSLTPTETPPRRSTRPTQLPAHLQDYEVNHSKLLDLCYPTSPMMSTCHPISREALYLTTEVVGTGSKCEADGVLLAEEEI
ncbi:hypothetical protein ACOSP7_022161 [Xanthoceras sorbifolium]